MIRVLVVDDSATMRGLIAATLASEPGIEVVGQAQDPLQAREAIKALDPDVVTLDVEMPNMNGLDFLERLMRLRPTPVVMVSTLTARGAEASLHALELGAVDCVAKPSSDGGAGFRRLAETVKAAASARLRASRAAPNPPNTGDYAPDGRLLAIGSSTGGVEALMTLIERMPRNCPPTVITQHMPATFTHSFAQRMDRVCAARVSEAVDGDPIEAGRIYLAPGGGQHLLVDGKSKLRCRLVESDPVNGHRPSVDVLFASVARAAGGRSVGAILTGMGRDGAAGLLAMRHAGAETLGQDEATCVVYGMPKAAFEIGAVERQLPLERLAQHILNTTNANRSGKA